MEKAENILKDKFADKPVFTKNELNYLLRKYNLSPNDNALRQLVYKLTKSGVLQSPKRGVYTINTKELYKPREDIFIKKIVRLFKTEFSSVNYCIWSSSWLNEFMIHQAFSHFYIFETESDMTETTFNLFADKKINAFISPDEEIIENYVSRAENPVIIDKLRVRSPINQSTNIFSPKPEKILVDIFSDKIVFNYCQGAELINVFSNFTENFFINYSSLYDYAAIRGKKHEIQTFLKNNIDINPLLLR